MRNGRNERAYRPVPLNALTGFARFGRGLAAVSLSLCLLACVGCGAPSIADGGGSASDGPSASGEDPAPTAEALPDGMRVVRVAQAEGTVSCFKGNAGDGINAVPGMNLAGGDGIGTGPASGALMEIDGDKTAEAGESIRMTVASLLGDARKNNTVMTLESGTAFFRLHRKLGEGETFEVETPTCILGVRGTQFFVTVTPEATLVGVFEGHVRVEPRIAPTTTASAAALPAGAITLTGNDWLSVPNGPPPAEGLVVKPITWERIPPFVRAAIKAKPEGIPEKWTGTSGLLPEPDWAPFDQLALGMTMLDAQAVLGMDGDPSETLPGMRTFWYNGATVIVVANPDGRVTSFEADGFPQTWTKTSMTRDAWFATQFYGKPLEAVEALLGTSHRVAGRSIDPKTGTVITRIEWQLAERAHVSVNLKDGVVDTLGSSGEW